MSSEHIPVLAQELIEGLDIKPDGHYLDATLGRGGHTRLILASYPNVQVTAIDRDETAINACQGLLYPDFGSRIQFWQGNFADYQEERDKFQGIIADLGVSSPQFDQPERGFSFRYTAPLDMRMDLNQGLTAAEMINHWPEKELADIFYNYGEERLSRRIARKIVLNRPLKTTTDLADLVSTCYPSKARYGGIHPATRVFQALRIVVNDELGSLVRFLSVAPRWLKIGGRIAIISFHSLEDRRVKYAFRDSDILEVITKKPITPDFKEIKQNPRSRSAKLRIAQRQ